VSWFCIDGSAVDDVDFSAAATLRSIYASLKEQGIRLVFTEVMEDVRTESRYQLTKLVGEDAFFTTKDDVVTAFKQQRGSNPEPGDSES
jgi:anti-anti-sigma regulatory factor